VERGREQKYNRGYELVQSMLYTLSNCHNEIPKYYCQLIQEYKNNKSNKKINQQTSSSFPEHNEILRLTH
jgi:hypothetical protein